MTPIEELQYLANLTCEACKWRIADGDTRSGLEMEVEDRLARLNEELNGASRVSVSKPSTDYSPKDAWSHERVRVRFSDGKQHWARREHCTKVQRTDRPNLWKWELLPEFEKEYNFNQKEDVDDGRADTEEA